MGARVPARQENWEEEIDLAVVMGSEKLTNTPDGPLLSRRFTNVWRSEGGSWRLVVRQATLIG
jgi:ketosteroid isomerase-like protein